MGVLDLDAEFVFDRSLVDGDGLATLQGLIGRLLPVWSSDLRILLPSGRTIEADTSRSGSLAKAVLEAAGERGEAYRAFVAEHGPGPHQRFFGSAELRGRGDEVCIVIGVDEWIAAPIGSRTALGNDVVIQVRGSQIEGESRVNWTRSAFRALCEAMSPAWAAAYNAREYDRKVMSTGRTIEAVGRDFGRSLPGLFWLNFFGEPYVRMLGHDLLLSSPSHAADEVDTGVLLELGSNPDSWELEAYSAVEERAREHLGRDLFFSWDAPEVSGRVPTWGRAAS